MILVPPPSVETMLCEVARWVAHAHRANVTVTIDDGMGNVETSEFNYAIRKKVLDKAKGE